MDVKIALRPVADHHLPWINGSFRDICVTRHATFRNFNFKLRKRWEFCFPSVNLATTEAADFSIHHRHMSQANLTLVSKWCALKQNQPTTFLLCKWVCGCCNSLFVFSVWISPKKKKLLVFAPRLDHNFYENISFASLSWHILSAFMRRRDAARDDSKKCGLRSTTCIRPQERNKQSLHKVDV